jgi:hypothetical protein
MWCVGMKIADSLGDELKTSEKGEIMTTVSGTTNSSLYSYASNRLSELLTTHAATPSDKEIASTSKTGDTVSLSSDVTTAKAREYIGLSPTGRLTLADFKTAATDQKDTVNTLLASAMEELGIDADQKISLSWDDDGDIVISEKFSGKRELEDALNEDTTFVKAFKGLSANNEVLDYVKSLQTNSVSLVNTMNSETSDEDLMALATKHATIKAGGGSIETLWRLGRSETPYTHAYNVPQ